MVFKLRSVSSALPLGRGWYGYGQSGNLTEELLIEELARSLSVGFFAVVQEGMDGTCRLA
jgi:hypothetical protein